MSKVDTVVIDYGHGGKDLQDKYVTAPNKMHKFSNGEVVYEGVLNRKIGKSVKKELEKCGLKVIETAPDYKDTPLEARVELSNRQNKESTVFVSIHFNAFGKGARGFEIYTTKGETQADILSEYIFQEVKPLYQYLNIPMRQDYSDGDSDKEENFYVLRNTTCPAVLIECLFFDNEQDYKLIKNQTFNKLLVRQITNGILKYVDSRK